jgi:hypothetical protein
MPSPTTAFTRGCPTKRRLSGLLIGALAVLSLTAAACSGDSADDATPTTSAGSNVTPAASGTKAPPAATVVTSGSDEAQIESMVRGFSARTEALDADGSFALMCQSFLAKIDQKQVKQNMEGYKNAGNAAPKISNLQFASIKVDGSNGEAIYSYTQDFRNQTTTINEGLKVAKEGGKWCIKDQIVVDNPQLVTPGPRS